MRLASGLLLVEEVNGFRNKTGLSQKYHDTRITKWYHSLL